MPLTPSTALAEDEKLQLLAAGPFETIREIEDFLDASDEIPPGGGMSERATLVDNKRLQAVAPTASSWDRFMAVVNATASVAGVASAIAGAISGVYAVAQL